MALNKAGAGYPLAKATTERQVPPDPTSPASARGIGPRTEDATGRGVSPTARAMAQTANDPVSPNRPADGGAEARGIRPDDGGGGPRPRPRLNEAPTLLPSSARTGPRDDTVRQQAPTQQPPTQQPPAQQPPAQQPTAQPRPRPRLNEAATQLPSTLLPSSAAPTGPRGDAVRQQPPAQRHPVQPQPQPTVTATATATQTATQPVAQTPVLDSRTAVADVAGKLKEHLPSLRKAEPRIELGPLSIPTTWGGAKNAVQQGNATTYGAITQAVERLAENAAGLSARAALAALRDLDGKIKGWIGEHADDAGKKRDALTALGAEVRNAIKSLAGPAVVEQLPDGATLDPDGTLGGVARYDHVPGDTTKLAGFGGRSVADALTTDVDRQLAGKKLPIGGLQVPEQAEKDLYRLDITIPGPGGAPWKTSGDPATDSAQRNANVVARLRQFTGDDNAAVVLSAVLTQGNLRPVHDSLQDADGGEQLVHLVSWREFDKDQAITMRTADGDVRLDRDEVSQYGNAKWELSRTPAGNYKVSVDWPVYFDGGQHHDPSQIKQYATDPWPLHDGGVVQAHFRFAIEVDAAAAAAGKASISLPQPIEVGFAGKVTI